MFLRWMKFNFVGAAGIAVQLAVLWLLVSGLGFNYLVATAIAVETAVLHNFMWHERFTWRDRATTGRCGALLRLVRFNLTTGLVSIFGNLILMRLLVGSAHLQYLAANLITICACNLLNFGFAELFVYRLTR